MIKKFPNRGEIWIAYLKKTNSSIQGGSRPVVIISNDYFNESSNVVHIIPITSSLKPSRRKRLPVHVPIDHTKYTLRKESTVIVEQLNLIPKKDVLKFVSKLDEKDVTRIEDAIKLQLGIF